MTLILTAICKNGMCVCADKRYKIISSSGSVKFEDTHNKIYKFQQIPYMILNHGINRIDNKDWRVYCSEYEALDRWKGKSQFQIVDDFKDFIENSIEKELNRYKDGKKHAIGFILGGKASLENKYKVNELHWLLESNEIKFTLKRHQFFVITGDGKVCLDTYLNNHLELLTGTYWKGFRLNQAENELIRLFNLAVNEKATLGHDDFSDSYDIEWIT
ncbi:MAG: hypothetical protein ABH873_04180 [Candidatus Firestonebacteria bacterium]